MAGDQSASGSERILDLDPDDDPHVDKYDGEPVENVEPFGPVYLVEVKGDTILVAEHEIVEREVRADGGTVEDGSERSDLLDEYRTAPLKFPLHILDEYGEALCGNLTEEQARFLDREGYTDQPTLSEKRGDEPWMTFLTNLCGNCRQSFLAEIDDEDVHEGWEKLQEAVNNV